MKIVNRATFLALPAGTIFSKVDTPPTYGFHGLAFKWDTCAGVDFVTQDIEPYPENVQDSEDWISKIDRLHAGESLKLDLDSAGRDGLFDKDQLFCVLEREDVAILLAQIANAYVLTFGSPPPAAAGE